MYLNHYRTGKITDLIWDPSSPVADTLVGRQTPASLAAAVIGYRQGRTGTLGIKISLLGMQAIGRVGQAGRTGR